MSEFPIVLRKGDAYLILFGPVKKTKHPQFEDEMVSPGIHISPDGQIDYDPEYWTDLPTRSSGMWEQIYP